MTFYGREEDKSPKLVASMAHSRLFGREQEHANGLRSSIKNPLKRANREAGSTEKVEAESEEKWVAAGYRIPSPIFPPINQHHPPTTGVVTDGELCQQTTTALSSKKIKSTSPSMGLTESSVE